jgi:hypothetical protein
MGALGGERVETGGVEPADPLTQVESLRVEGRARVAREEPANGLLGTVTNWVDIDQQELAHDFTDMGGGVHESSPSLLMENSDALSRAFAPNVTISRPRRLD